MTEGQRALLYDADAVVWMRAGGLAFASFMFNLMSFMVRAAKSEADKREAADRKRAATREQNKNTVDGQWSEAAPIGAPQLPNGGEVEAEVVAEADTGRKVKGAQHPDRAGDNAIPGAKGDQGTDGTEEPGKPQT